MTRFRSIRTFVCGMLLQGASAQALIQTSAPNTVTVEYTQGAFAGGTVMLVASGIPGGQDYAIGLGLMQFVDQIDGSTTTQFSLSPLTPQQVSVNKNLMVKDSGFDGVNPLYNPNAITNFTLFGGGVAATFDGPDTLPGGFGTNRRICVIPDVNNPSIIFTHVNEIPDATGASTNAIRALAGSGNRLFAAVEANGGGLDDADAGIARITQDLIGLLPNGNATPFPDLDGMQNTISLFWHSSLQRLFVGLHRAGTVAAQCTLLVGYFDGFGDFQLEDAIDPANLDANNQIIGGNAGIESHVRLIRSITTSTGKQYLVVQAESDGDIANKIYALPLVTTGAIANIGKIAAKNDPTFSNPVAAPGEVTNSDEPQALIGGAQLPMADDGIVNDIYIIGETVYVSLANDRANDTDEAGVFSSTGLLDDDGRIIAWTPWQRVASTFEKTYTVGRDMYGQIWNVDNADLATLNATTWVQNDSLQNMSFGVRDTLSLPVTTPGLKAFPTENSGTFGIFVNSQQVLVVNTTAVENDNDAPEVGTATRSFMLPNPLATCSVEVSRIDLDAGTPHHGWIFVGGYTGVAVLRDPATGNGWPTDVNEGLSADLTNIDGFTFKEIGTFSAVRRLVSTGNHLYVATTGGLSRFTMTPAKFADVAAPLNAEEDVTIPDVAILDMCIIDDTIFLATTQGLWYNTIANFNAGGWQEFEVNNASLGPVLGFAVQRNGDPSVATIANLWVLAGEITKDLCSIYRLVKKPGALDLIPGLQPEFLDLGFLQGALAVHDQILYSMLNRHLGRTALIAGYPVMYTSVAALKSAMITPKLGVDTTQFRRVSPMVRLDGLGTLMLAGDWGIIAQQ